MRALGGYRPTAAAVGVGPPDGLEWFELLRHKLLPQVARPPCWSWPWIGGTNIGKSVVFNHLAGEMASGVSPLAAGTKHPVCLVPARFCETRPLARCSKASSIVPVANARRSAGRKREGTRLSVGRGKGARPAVAAGHARHRLRCEVNWHRADVIRQSADVLIAVLTQQKYNDAAVKRFFRKAAEADKPVMVVFNQCDLARRSAILAAVAGDLRPASRGSAGTGLRRSLRSDGRSRARTCLLLVGPDGRAESSNGGDLAG